MDDSKDLGDSVSVDEGVGLGSSGSIQTFCRGREKGLSFEIAWGVADALLKKPGFKTHLLSSTRFCGSTVKNVSLVLHNMEKEDWIVYSDHEMIVLKDPRDPNDKPRIAGPANREYVGPDGVRKELMNELCTTVDLLVNFDDRADFPEDLAARVFEYEEEYIRVMNSNPLMKLFFIDYYYAIIRGVGQRRSAILQWGILTVNATATWFRADFSFKYSTIVKSSAVPVDFKVDRKPILNVKVYKIRSDFSEKLIEKYICVLEDMKMRKKLLEEFGARITSDLVDLKLVAHGEVSRISFPQLSIHLVKKDENLREAEGVSCGVLHDQRPNVILRKVFATKIFYDLKPKGISDDIKG